MLDIGCGKHKTPGAVGLDSNPRTGADVIHDLDRVPYPFPDNQFDLIIGNQVIEHVEDVLGVVAELYRVTRPGGRIRLDTPHFSDIASYTDPTHRHHLTTESFANFTRDPPDIDLEDDLVAAAVVQLFDGEGVRELVEVVEHVRVRARVAVHPHRPRRLVLPAPDVEYLHARPRV